MEELARKLQAAGTDIEWYERLPGFRRFYASDPWGNRLEFLQRA